MGPYPISLIKVDLPTQDNIVVTIFSDETAIIAIYQNLIEASRLLPNNIHEIEN